MGNIGDIEPIYSYDENTKTHAITGMQRIGQDEETAHKLQAKGAKIVHDGNVWAVRYGRELQIDFYTYDEALEFALNA